MPGLSLQAVLLWFSAPILQLLCVYLLYRRNLLKQFRFFASYLLFLTLLNAIRFFCYRQFGLNSWAYYSAYWIGTALANMIVIAVLYEIFCSAFKPLAGLQDLARIVFKWAAGSLFFIGLIVFLSSRTSSSGAPYRWLADSIYNFEEVVCVMELALLLFMFVGSQQLGIAIRTRVFGIAFGFGFHALCRLLLYITLAPHRSKHPPLSLAIQIAAFASMLIWVGYLLKPESSTESVHIPVTSPLLRWNEAAEQFLALAPRLSKEQYSVEDRDMLRSIATSLALLLVKPKLPERECFQECGNCGVCYDSHVLACPNDGSPAVAIPIPRLLAQRYRLERRIGCGGMGTVYAATDIELHRHVAAKLIREGLIGNPGAARRFSSEARAAAGFCHPNVVTIHDFGVTSTSRAFLIMELLEGRALREEMKETHKIPGARTLQILRGVCAGLEAAHQQQLVHRDLKPENIFIARAGAMEIPKLLDFGLAKFLPPADSLSAETASADLVGTPRYMSPEQLRGLALEPHWDLWALSVIAYEMLCKAHPFATGNLADFRSTILLGRYVSVNQYLPDAPRGLPVFFEAAFSVNLARRPSSVKGWLESFECALAGQFLRAEA